MKMAAAGLAGLALSVGADPAGAAITVAPHRALYTLSLDHAQSGSGIVGAEGKMEFSWADACEGWTVEQRYLLHIRYGDAEEADQGGRGGAGQELKIDFVTFEGKDGRSYRFNVRKNGQSEGEDDQELRGTATMPPAGVGEAKFAKPEAQSVALPGGTLFPTAHTLALIAAAQGGETFISKQVFDGGQVEPSVAVSAGFGRLHEASIDDPNPLLRSRWWPMRLAFFPADGKGTEPDYELGMDLQENGVARNMTLDYGNFAVKATLDTLEPLTKPGC